MSISIAYGLVNCFYLTHVVLTDCNSLHMLLMSVFRAPERKVACFVGVVVPVIRPTG